jgi:hypothetical protein
MAWYLIKDRGNIFSLHVTSSRSVSKLHFNLFLLFFLSFCHSPF